MNVVTSEKQRKTDMPIRLLASTKDGQGVNVITSSEDEGAGKRRAECRKLFGRQDGIRSPKGSKKLKGTNWCSRFGRGG